MTRDGHASQFEGMLVLAMASARDDQKPSIVFDQIDYIPNFHLEE
jgi:hypothetical protein